MLDIASQPVAPTLPEMQPDGVDRRREVRQSTHVPASIGLGLEEVDCVILDVSASGVRVRTDENQPVMVACIGQQMILSPRGGEPVAVTLRWVNGRGLGLQFLAATESGDGALAGGRAGSVPSARPGRAQVAIPAAINLGGRQFKGTILNISVGGALIESEADLLFGQQIVLETNIVRPIAAYVRWQKKGMVGVMFGRLLPVDSAKIISEEFAVHPMWMHEVIRCHEGTLDWSHSSERDQKKWWSMAGD